MLFVSQLCYMLKSSVSVVVSCIISLGFCYLFLVLSLFALWVAGGQSICTWSLFPSDIFHIFVVNRRHYYYCRKPRLLWAGQSREFQEVCHIWVYVCGEKRRGSAATPRACRARRGLPVSRPYVIYGRNDKFSEASQSVAKQSMAKEMPSHFINVLLC